MKHLNGLMDEATIIVDKFVKSDPEQVRWHNRICESFEGTQVSVVATPWDQALANRVPLDLNAVSDGTLDAKLEMAEIVLRGVDRANRRRQGPPAETADAGNGEWNPTEPPLWLRQPALPPGVIETPEPVYSAPPEHPGEGPLADAGGHADDASRPRWPDSY
jgi:hypothetical protein